MVNIWRRCEKTLAALFFGSLCMHLDRNGCISWCQENSYCSSPEWLEKVGRRSPHLPRRTIYNTTTLAWKMPSSWHQTGYSGGYWQQSELRIKKAEAEQRQWTNRPITIVSSNISSRGDWVQGSCTFAKIKFKDFSRIFQGLSRTKQRIYKEN